MTMLLFLAGTLLFAWLSRHSLRHWRSHGFFRFWAWECLLLLLLHNIPHWFDNRFASHQLLSWLLLFSSAGIAIYSTVLLRRYGAHDHQRQDPSLLHFERTAQLVTQGLYAHIRHPMYSSLLLLAWGLFLKQPLWWPGALLAVGATVTLHATAVTEETENLAYFGDSYRQYMRNTWRFLPFW
ncbi:MAG: isoprenylcysteine carboxylmethyltransferase family protein [Pseudomonadales bacterium]|nr:isoprenylcysteine carboxylmethyltransferase family protein [Pseudomonadales bacterium]